MNPTFGSLFAGVGGFDLGFEAAGYDCKFQVEWDKHCQQVLGYHWPDVPRWGDVSEATGSHAKTYPSLGNAPALTATDLTCSLKQSESSQK